MKKTLIALFMVFIASCNAPETPSKNTVNVLDKAAYEGRWVVINYWAEWCKPCIKEIPELNALDRKYEQVAVLGVNYDGNKGDQLQAQITALKIDFPTLVEDPSGVLGVALPSVLPTTLILDPDGQLITTLVGPQTLESLALATGQVGMPDADPAASDVVEQEMQDQLP
ncbi:MAG: TlpA disulfide reductase family protein [Halioglobus sp.]